MRVKVPGVPKFSVSKLVGETQKSLYPEKQVLNDEFKSMSIGNKPRLRLRFKKPKTTGLGGGFNLGG